MRNSNEMIISVEIENNECKVNIENKLEELKVININIMTSTGEVIEKKIEF